MVVVLVKVHCSICSFSILVMNNFLRTMIVSSQNVNVLKSSAFVWGFMHGTEKFENFFSSPLETTFNASIVGASFYLGSFLLLKVLPPPAFPIVNILLWCAISSRLVQKAWRLFRRRYYLSIRSFGLR